MLSRMIAVYTAEKQSGWSDKTKMEVAGVFKLLVDKVVKFKQYKSGRIACKLDGQYSDNESYLISDNMITIK